MKSSDKVFQKEKSSESRVLLMLPDNGLLLLNSLLPGQASIEQDPDGCYFWEWRCTESSESFTSPQAAFRNLIEYILEDYESLLIDDEGHIE